MKFKFTKPTIHDGKRYVVGEEDTFSAAKAKELQEGNFGVIITENAEPDTLEKMTVPELKAFAKSRGVDTKNLTKKSELIEAIKAVAAPPPADAE